MDNLGCFSFLFRTKHEDTFYGDFVLERSIFSFLPVLSNVFTFVCLCRLQRYNSRLVILSCIFVIHLGKNNSLSC